MHPTPLWEARLPALLCHPPRADGYPCKELALPVGHATFSNATVLLGRDAEPGGAARVVDAVLLAVLGPRPWLQQRPPAEGLAGSGAGGGEPPSRSHPHAAAGWRGVSLPLNAGLEGYAEEERLARRGE